MKRVIALLLAAFMLCGCQKDTPVPTEPETVPPAAETTVPEETKAVQPDFSFGDLKEWEFLFASGVGSWGTQVRIGEDGSFSGEFYDHDNETGEGYPYGIQYWCDFTGTFSQPEWISPYACSITVESLEFEAEPGTVELRNQVKYVADEPRGLALGEKFMLYLPGASTEGMSEDFLYWITGMNPHPPVDGCLTAYALENTNQEIGYYGENIYVQEREALKDTEDRAAALEEQLQGDGTLSQGDMNSLAWELYQVWDDELNQLWRFLKKTLDEDTMAELTREQLQWISEKEAAARAAGEEVGGGSLSILLEEDCAARLTRERVYYLAEKYLP